MTTETGKAPAADPAAAADPKGADPKAGDPAAGNPGAKAGDPAADPKAAAAAAGYRPEGLPDHLAGKDDKETIDKMHQALTGFREAQAKKGVPKTADEYTLTLADDIKDKVLKPDASGKDPLVEKLKPILHKHGIPQQAFNEMAAEFYGAVVALQGAAGNDDTPEADFEFKSLGGADKARPIQDGANAWINGLKSHGKIDDKAVAELQLLTYHAEGLHALNQLRVLTGEKPIPANLGGDAPEGITKEKLDARVADEKYWKHKDPDFIAETTRLFGEFYGQKKSA